MKIQNNKWFTLVELIVVVTILAILSTIWFVSYSWYLSWVRDTNRVSQLKAIWDSLHLYTTKSSLPLPDDKINITTDWSNIISYQWYAWKNVIEAIWYTSEWKDPQDNTYFSYVVTKDRKYFQLLAYLEEEKETTQLNSLNLVNAIDYEIRYPHVEWSKLWILLTDTNQPIHEVETTIDLSSAPIWTKSILSNWETQTWSLTSINPLASCKRLYETRWKREDWVYTIDPEWNWTWFKVYCDMNTDWGGWTMLRKNFWWPKFLDHWTPVSNNTLWASTTWSKFVKPYSISKTFWSEKNIEAWNSLISQTWVELIKLWRWYENWRLSTNTDYSYEIKLDLWTWVSFDDIMDTTACKVLSNQVEAFVNWESYWKTNRTSWYNQASSMWLATILDHCSQQSDNLLRTDHYIRHLISYNHTAVWRDTIRCQRDCWDGSEDIIQETIWWIR